MPPKRKHKTSDNGHELLLRDQTPTPSIADNDSASSVEPGSSYQSSDQHSAAADEQDVDHLLESADKRRIEYTALRHTGIMVEMGVRFPPALETLINRLRASPRRDVSPMARYFADHASTARLGNTVDAKMKYRDALSLRDRLGGGHKFAITWANTEFDTSFLSQNEWLEAANRPTTQSMPDTACGYVTNLHVPSGEECPFTFEEERCMFNSTIRNARTGDDCPLSVLPEWSLYFPYFTVQWGLHEPMWEAITRGARDGAIVNEYLRSVFISAQGDEEPIEPDVTTTVHFSGTFDGYLAMLWAHWYDSDCDEYRQEVIGRYIVDEEAHMLEYRRFLKNWEEETMTTRLEAVKKAVR